MKIVRTQSFQREKIDDVELLIPFQGNVIDNDHCVLLEGIAPEIWDLIEEHDDVETVINILLNRYIVSRDELTADCISVLKVLEEANLVKIFEE